MNYTEVLEQLPKSEIKINFIANLLKERIDNIILFTESTYFIDDYADSSRLDDRFMAKLINKTTKGHLDILDIYFQLFLSPIYENLMCSVSFNIQSSQKKILFIITFAEIGEIRHEVLVLMKN